MSSYTIFHRGADVRGGKCPTLDEHTYGRMDNLKHSKLGITNDRKKQDMDSADPQNRSEWRGSL